MTHQFFDWLWDLWLATCFALLASVVWFASVALLAVMIDEYLPRFVSLINPLGHLFTTEFVLIGGWIVIWPASLLFVVIERQKRRYRRVND